MKAFLCFVTDIIGLRNSIVFISLMKYTEVKRTFLILSICDKLSPFKGLDAYANKFIVA